MRTLGILAAAGALLPSLGFAEQVFLKSGGRLEGELVERTATHVVLQIGPGEVRLPLASVDRITQGRSALATYRERVARLSNIDREGWLDVALWARDQGLETQAREAFRHVVALDPSNPLAQAGIGNVPLNGRWVTPEESYHARGYVRFEGAWMLPEERDETIRDRSERRAEVRARAESEARIAEAEAGARAAEAAARAVAAESSGIPLEYLGGGYYGGYAYGSGYGSGYGHGRGVRGRTGYGYPNGYAGSAYGLGGVYGPNVAHGSRTGASAPVRVPTSSIGNAAAPPPPAPAPTPRRR